VAIGVAWKGYNLQGRAQQLPSGLVAAANLELEPSIVAASDTPVPGIAPDVERFVVTRSGDY